MLLISESKSKIDELKSILNSKFDMKDLGGAKKILGISITKNRNNSTMKLSQFPYIQKVISKFSMENAKEANVPLGGHYKLSADQSPVTNQEREDMMGVPYANAVGSVMYMMLCTRPDLAHSISVLSRYMGNPGRDHWEAMKWLLRYIKSIINEGLVYKSSKSAVLTTVLVVNRTLWCTSKCV